MLRRLPNRRFRKLGSVRSQPQQSAASRSPNSVPQLSSQTPPHVLESQSFSRSFGSILPTSLNYIILKTRGCKPWRPDAVICTVSAVALVPSVFKDLSECSEPPRNWTASTDASALSRIEFNSRVYSIVKKKRKLSSGNR